MSSSELTHPAPCDHREPTPATEAVANQRSAWLRPWIKTILRWHWISSAICLVGLLAFSATGITLNNAGLFESSRPQVVRHEATLPPSLLGELTSVKRAGNVPLPSAVRDMLSASWGVALPAVPAEWSSDEVSVAMPRPGVDVDLRIDLASGRADYEASDRGWVAFFDDLHKGRHAGPVWSWFIDVMALGCVVFSLTGLLLLLWHAPVRPLIWPVTVLGAIVPLLLALIFIH
jgi:hypothetical protein